MTRGTKVWLGFVVGLVVLPLNTLWVFHLEAFSGRGPFVSTISLFLNVVFVCVMVALANAAVRRLSPRFALNRLELIIIYVMLTISTSLMGHDMLQVLVPVMTVGHWFATPGNSWAQMLQRTTPSWLVVSDQEALYGYWNGNSSAYTASVVQAWMTPILWWSGFTCALLLVLVCMMVIVRPLWADRERLTFPVIQLPLELTDPRTSLVRNRLLWTGIAVAGGVDLLNGLSVIYPAIPSIPLRSDLNRYITDAPWTGIGWLPVTFNPSIIGLSFLMPLDLMFSGVFFLWWWKALGVVAVALGTGTSGTGWEPDFPYSNQQMFGGFLAIAVGSILVSRGYFHQVWLRALGRPSDADDIREGVSFRLAILGMLVGFALLVAFCLRGGMSPIAAVSFFGIYFALALAVARIRAEFGSPVHDFHWAGPDYMLPYVFGTASLRPRDLGMFGLFWWFNRAYRAHPVANSLEGLQMAARARVSGRPIVAAVFIAAIATMLVGLWAYLHFGYRLGAASGWPANPSYFGREALDRLQSWTETSRPPSMKTVMGMVMGFGVTMLLVAARTRFIGFPLHPVAYAVTASWSIHLVWMPMLIAWAAKACILRYGGLRLYRQVLPLFLGLILGESMIGCAWPLVGLALHLPTSFNFFGA